MGSLEDTWLDFIWSWLWPEPVHISVLWRDSAVKTAANRVVQTLSPHSDWQRKQAEEKKNKVKKKVRERITTYNVYPGLLSWNIHIKTYCSQSLTTLTNTQTFMLTKDDKLYLDVKRTVLFLWHLPVLLKFRNTNNSTWHTAPHSTAQLFLVSKRHSTTLFK